MRLILFDIDGTLLWTNGAGRRAIHRALLDEMGTAGPLHGYPFHGENDPHIGPEPAGVGGPPSHSSRPARRNGHGGTHRWLPLRREDRSADRARAAGAGGPPGV